jgi:ATP-dependent Clp protease ATP-binding subunit ClpC
MFEHFTDMARRSVVLSQEAARRLGSDEIGTEHLLLGISQTPPGRDALEELTIGPAAIEARVPVVGPPGPDTGHPYVPFSPDAKRSLESALHVSLDLGATEIEPRHLIVGIAMVSESSGARLLDELGADLDLVRDALAAGVHTSEPRRRWWRR